MKRFARWCRSFRPPAGDARRLDSDPSPSSGAEARGGAGGGDAEIFLPPAPQHERAAEAGRLKDLAWFRCHPERCYRIRKSLPFECHDWGAHDHKEFRFMAVYAAPDRGEYRRHAIRADRRPGRSEEFVRRIFERIDAFEGDGVIRVAPDDHATYLRQAGERE